LGIEAPFVFSRALVFSDHVPVSLDIPQSPFLECAESGTPSLGQVEGPIGVGGPVVELTFGFRGLEADAHDLRGSHGLQLQAENELRSTLDDAGIGTWSWDLVSGKIALSETCAQLLGAARLEVEDFSALSVLVHPDDREERARVIQNAIEHGGSYDVDYRVMRPGGQACWLRSRASEAHL